MGRSEGGFLLAAPELDWTEGGPRSRQSGDVYFSAEDGLAETRTVFLKGCGLPERFTDRAVFTVAELGFGTGLNALALWDLWRAHRPQGARLHMISVEANPFRRDQAARALSAFPELSALADPLLGQWPAPLKGLHRLHFDEDGFTLTLAHGRAPAILGALEFAADAWFLDGFAPAANPDMWSAEICAQIARLSAPGARAATFTVAGAVRRGLSAVGFAVEKRPGFGRKRGRLEAVFTDPSPHIGMGPPRRAGPIGGRIAVIGGGVAAASLARAFARRDVAIEIIAEGGWASGASSAPAGLLTPRLEAADRPHARALLNAFDYARRLYEGAPGFHGEGALRQAKDDAGEARLKRIADMLDEDYVWLDAHAAEARTALKTGRGGLWMGRAGRFEPARLVEALGRGSPWRDAAIARIERAGAVWRLLAADGAVLHEAETLILAGGAAMGELLGETGLELEASAGSVLTAQTGRDVRAPLVWGGYIARCGSKAVLLGATHLRGADPGPPDKAEAQLRAALAERAPQAAAALGPAREVWSGIRAAVRDRLPVLGPVPAPGPAPATSAAPAGAGAQPEVLPGLYVLSGFGARGFAHAPLLAEALVSDLCGEPAALERSARAALDPGRFITRQARRG